jgi:hypothetical protein
MSTNTTLTRLMRERAAFEEPRMRQASERPGDDFGVNLTHVRALGKRLRTQHELALESDRMPFLLSDRIRRRPSAIDSWQSGRRAPSSSVPQNCFSRPRLKIRARPASLRKNAHNETEGG